MPITERQHFTHSDITSGGNRVDYKHEYSSIFIEEFIAKKSRKRKDSDKLVKLFLNSEFDGQK